MMLYEKKITELVNWNIFVNALQKFQYFSLKLSFLKTLFCSGLMYILLPKRFIPISN